MGELQDGTMSDEDAGGVGGGGGGKEGKTWAPPALQESWL